jgi:NAD+ kinase
MTEIRKIGIIANVYKEKSVEYARELRDWLRQRGLEVVFEKGVADKTGETGIYTKETLAAMVDMVVVFGGDGTLLMAARSLREFSVPILGVNLGGFGFLTVVNLQEMFSDLEMILQGNCRIEKRMMLDASVSRDDRLIAEYTVLNDAVISRGSLCRLLDMETLVDDQYMTTYKADGLIVSTPTGSTAYSLSAGGPIVMPQLDSIIVNPICPHTLTNRPVILPQDATVKISSWTREGYATLTLDGQISCQLEPTDLVTVRKSRYYTNLIMSPHRDYLEILRTKLGWGGLSAPAK